jgi:hypothetical protein
VTLENSLPLDPAERDRLLVRYANEVFRAWRARGYLLLLALAVVGVGAAAWRGTTERKIVATELAAEQRGVLSDALGRVDQTRKVVDRDVSQLREKSLGVDKRLAELTARQADLAAASQAQARSLTVLDATVSAYRGSTGPQAGTPPFMSSEVVRMLGLHEEHARRLEALAADRDRQSGEIAELRRLVAGLSSRLDRQEQAGEASYVLREKSDRRLIHPPVTLALGKIEHDRQKLVVQARDGAVLASQTVDLTAPKPIRFQVDGFEYEVSPIYREPHLLWKDRVAITVRRVPAK